MKILTFDIEEFTIYSKNNLGSVTSLFSLFDKLLDLLDEKGIKATFFCLGEIAREYPDVIKQIDARKHTIGCHSDKHNLLIQLTDNELYKDTCLALDSIEQITGRKVLYYRAPAFSIGERNKWAIGVLKRCGIEIDCSIFPAVRDFGGFPAFVEDRPVMVEYNGSSIKELPMSVTSLFGTKIAYSGGGYFRLFPYPLIKKIMNESDYVMTYFHLRDFDTMQNKNISLRYFKNYYGIKGACHKFEKLVSDFDFIGIDDADKMIDWNKCESIRL